MALNKAIEMGRLTKDPETKYLQSINSSVTRFTLAVERDYKAANEEKPKTDFIDCVAWGKKGEFIERYFKKGDKLTVTGRIETDLYTDKDGKKVKTTAINVEEAHFTESKKNSNSNSSDQGYETDSNGFMNIPDGIDEELPFN